MYSKVPDIHQSQILNLTDNHLLSIENLTVSSVSHQKLETTSTNISSLTQNLSSFEKRVEWRPEEELGWNLSILATRKTIFNEARSVIYGLNHSDLFGTWQERWLSVELLHIIGTTNAAHIECLRIGLPKLELSVDDRLHPKEISIKLSAKG